MSFESESQYFVAQYHGLDGSSLKVYYAPSDSKELVVPKKILTVNSFLGLRGIVEGKIKNAELSMIETAEMTIEPRSIEQVYSTFAGFVTTRLISELSAENTAPPDFRLGIMKTVETVMPPDSHARVALILGLPNAVELQDGRPYPGQYL